MLRTRRPTGSLAHIDKEDLLFASPPGTRDNRESHHRPAGSGPANSATRSSGKKYSPLNSCSSIWREPLLRSGGIEFDVIA